MTPIARLAAALTLAAAPALAENHASPDMVVATVNGTDITLAHMMVLKARLPQEYQQLPPEMVFEGVLDQLIQQTLLGDGTELSAGSAATLENEERALRANEAIVALVDEEVTEDALRAAYDAEFAAGRREWDVSHILFEEEDGVDAEAEARQAIADLEDGADFAEIARERSDGPSAPNGGALGYYGQGALVPEFEQAMMEMEPGTFSSEPVRTQFGWHVIYLHDTRQVDAPPFEQVQQALVQQVRRDVIQKRVEELQASADITRKSAAEVDPALLNDLSLLGR